MARKTAASRSSAGRKRHGARRSGAARKGRRWSRHVTEHSDALTLDKGVFSSRDPKRIAASLKRSAERSKRRKKQSLSLRALHAHVLHQSCRQEPACFPQEDVDAREGRAAQAIRQGVTDLDSCLSCGGEGAPGR